MSDMLRQLGLDPQAGNGFSELAMADYARKMCEQSKSNARLQAQVDTHFGKPYDPPDDDCNDENMRMLVNNGVITDKETLRRFSEPEEQTRDTPPQPPQRPRRRLWPWLLAGFLLLGTGGGLATWAILNAISRISQSQLSLDFLEDRQLRRSVPPAAPE